MLCVDLQMCISYFSSNFFPTNYIAWKKYENEKSRWGQQFYNFVSVINFKHLNNKNGLFINSEITKNVNNTLCCCWNYFSYTPVSLLIISIFSMAPLLFSIYWENDIRHKLTTKMSKNILHFLLKTSSAYR